MTRLRSLRIRHLVLPFVLAALALRAFIPAGAMPDANGNLSFETKMCSTLDGSRSETAELPGEAPAASGPHCEFCGLPPLGAPFAQTPRLPDALPIDAPRDVVAQISEIAPARAPSARAPPVA